MEIRTLQYFLTIAREKNISKAAERLHMTQPTLSRQMKELEDQLGKQLFIRGNRQITLTDEGMILKKRAEEIISMVEKTEAEVMANEELLTGDIYVGCSEKESMQLIGQTILMMHKKHPFVKIHIIQGSHEDIAHLIDKGEIDFGIVFEPIDLLKYDYFKMPITNTWGVLMRKESPLSSLDEITADDLREYPLLCSQQELVKNEIAGWIGGNQRKFNIVGSYHSTSYISTLVKESHLHALCFIESIEGIDDSICIRPLTPRLQSHMVIIWKKYQVFSKVSEFFLEMLKEKQE